MDFDLDAAIEQADNRRKWDKGEHGSPDEPRTLTAEERELIDNWLEYGSWGTQANDHLRRLLSAHDALAEERDALLADRHALRLQVDERNAEVARLREALVEARLLARVAFAGSPEL